MGFFTRHAQATLSDGLCDAEELPPAAFGTLAIYSTSTNETVDIVGAGPGETIQFDGIDAADTKEAKLNRLSKFKGILIELKYQHISIATEIQPFSQGGRKAVVESLALCFPQYGC